MTENVIDKFYKEKRLGMPIKISEQILAEIIDETLREIINEIMDEYLRNYEITLPGEIYNQIFNELLEETPNEVLNELFMQISTKIETFEEEIKEKPEEEIKEKPLEQIPKEEIKEIPEEEEEFLQNIRLIEKLKNDYHQLICDEEDNTKELRELTRIEKDNQTTIEEMKRGIIAINLEIKLLEEQLTLISKPKQIKEKERQLRIKDNIKKLYNETVIRGEDNAKKIQNEYVTISIEQENIKIKMKNIINKLNELNYQGALPHQCFKIVEI
jgi:hypothetical protein